MVSINAPSRQFSKPRGLFRTTTPKIGRLVESPKVQHAIDQYKHIYAIPYHGDEARLRTRVNELYAYLVRGLTKKRIFHTEPLPNNMFRTSLDKTKQFWLHWH